MRSEFECAWLKMNEGFAYAPCPRHRDKGRLQHLVELQPSVAAVVLLCGRNDKRAPRRNPFA